MLSVYQNLKKTCTFQTEKRGGFFVIVKRDFWGKTKSIMDGRYETRDEAEIALEELADESGLRWVGRQDNG